MISIVICSTQQSHLSCGAIHYLFSAQLINPMIAFFLVWNATKISSRMLTYKDISLKRMHCQLTPTYCFSLFTVRNRKLAQLQVHVCFTVFPFRAVSLISQLMQLIKLIQRRSAGLSDHESMQNLSTSILFPLFGN